MRDIASVVGLKVISSKEGRELGEVSQVVVDLASGQIEGVIIGKGPTEKGVEAKDISVIGTDAVMVDTYKVARHLSEIPKLLEKRREPGAPPKEIVTDTGKRLGALGTIYIDPVNRRVSRYEVSGGAWRDITEGVVSLPPTDGAVDGRDSVIVPSRLLSEVEGAEGGLKAQLAKLAEVARSQAKQAAEGIDEGAKSVRHGVEAVGKKAGEAAAKLQVGAKHEEAKQADAPASEEKPADNAAADEASVENAGTNDTEKE